jgi:predicted nucleotidyltransferase
MSRQKVQNIILSYLRDYNPEFIGLFGSYARKENRKKSDIDILVRFHASYSLLQLLRIENELSDKLGIKVDLVTEGSIKSNRIKENIQKDLQIIYQI